MNHTDSAKQLTWYTREDVLTMLHNLLERPDMLIDAVTVENSQYDEEELLSIGMAGYHTLSIEEFAQKEKESEAQQFAEWMQMEGWTGVITRPGVFHRAVNSNEFATTAELYNSEEFKRYKEGKG